jgi:hypothetical protein
MRSDNLRAAPSWITPELVGRILAVAMPASGEALPVKTVPTRGVKPKLARVERMANLPETAGRQPEESEAAIVAPCAVSPRRHADRLKAEAAARIEANRPMFQLAFDRGIAVVDLAHALGMTVETTLVHTKKAGFRFGARPPLAERLTLAVLQSLADPEVPLPELRSCRLKRERLARSAKLRRDKRGDEVARRRAERAAAAEQRQAQREEAKAEVRRVRDAERDRRRAEKAALKSKPICEVKPAAICRPADQAPSREPALPADQQARAHPNPDPASIDRANKRRADSVRRGILAKAEELLDAGKTSGRGTNVHVKMAMRAVEVQRAEQARLGCPIEQAKRTLQRRYAPVCSMAVYGGDADLFIVGNRKNVTRDELLAMAARLAA